MDIQFGFILGFAVVLALGIGAIASSNYNNDKKVKTKYDERQRIARGKSFTYGFYAMMIANLLFMFAHLFGLADFLGSYGYFTAIIIGILVEMTYAIFKDAYMGLNTNPRKYMIFMACISGINIISTVIGIANSEMIQDGVLQTPYLNLLCSILFTVLVADLGIKHLLDKKEK